MKRFLLATVMTAATALPLAAQDDVAATRADIEATFGFVPAAMNGVADAALPGLWEVMKDFQLGDTALDVKTKALISLAVASQIPCQYCTFMDTETARSAGASEEEIKEAVSVAATTRAWSTIFYGTQADLDTFKTEIARLGGN